MDKTYDQVLKAKIRKTRRKYESWSLVYIVLAFLAHLPYLLWILFLMDVFGLGSIQAGAPKGYTNQWTDYKLHFHFDLDSHHLAALLYYWLSDWFIV